MSADLVLLDCKVITMNLNQPTAEAIAIKKDKIIQVGSNEAVSNTIGKNTKIIHLHGKTVIPGIIDTHIHVADFGRILDWLNLEKVASIREIQDCVNQKVKQTAKGKWIIGRGWDENRLAEKRLPTRFDLDKVSPENPTVLYHASGQVCVVNSKASELADITKHSANGIQKDQTGNFTGILRDEATNLVWNVIPTPDEEELLEASALALREITQAGITSIHWLPLLPIEIEVIKKLHKQNKLPIRVNVIAPVSFFDKVPNFDSQGRSQDKLRFVGFEIFADGYLAARTAALSKPYRDCPDQEGKLLCSEEDMMAIALKIKSAGFQLVIHAVGDKAIDTALNVIEKANEVTKRACNARIEQCAVLNEKLIERMRDLRVVVSVQPKVIASEFTVWSALNHLGPERARWLFPLKDLLQAKIIVAAGSDCPMEPLNPLLGIQELVKPQTSSEQRVSVEEALRMYTINAAYLASEEDVKGSIEIGKLADLVVLSANPQTVEQDKIVNISVEMTVIGGQVAP